MNFFHHVIYMVIGSILGNQTIINANFSNDTLVIREGVLCTTAKSVKYEKDGMVVASVEVSEPIMVAQAEQEEPWGFFQFPDIAKSKDGTLVVSWYMKTDSYKSYGQKNTREYSPMISKDEGKSWGKKDGLFKARSRAYNVCLKNGNYLQVSTPPARNVNSFEFFPEAVSKQGAYSYYFEKDLPDELRGVYLDYEDSNNNARTIHAKLIDSGLLRYAIDSLMPIVWWGNIKELSNHALVAGVYPSYYLNNENEVMPGSVSFYSSYDEGKSWGKIGFIPYDKSVIGYTYDKNKNNEGFTEPTFEILKDSTFICVMRTGSANPLYQSCSKDQGRTWSKPVPIAPNGVKPSLMLLKNGVLVLASGRPGIQLRFSFDGKGDEWSIPIDMVPFMKSDMEFDLFNTCGYASIIDAGDNSFYIVYSDFKTKNNKGEERKAIVFRKVTINI